MQNYVASFSEVEASKKESNDDPYIYYLFNLKQKITLFSEMDAEGRSH